MVALELVLSMQKKKKKKTESYKMRNENACPFRRQY
jgi:hypothetical protein